MVVHIQSPPCGWIANPNVLSVIRDQLLKDLPEPKILWVIWAFVGRDGRTRFTAPFGFQLPSVRSAQCNYMELNCLFCSCSPSWLTPRIGVNKRCCCVELLSSAAPCRSFLQRIFTNSYLRPARISSLIDVTAIPTVLRMSAK